MNLNQLQRILFGLAQFISSELCLSDSVKSRAYFAAIVLTHCNIFQKKQTLGLVMFYVCSNL